MTDWQRAKELLALSMISGVGPVLARQLLAHYKSGEVIFSRSVADLMAVPNVGAVVAKKIVEANTLEKAEQELELLEKRNIIPLLWNIPLAYATSPVLRWCSFIGAIGKHWHV